MAQVQVRADPEHSRYVAQVGATQVGLAAYTEQDDVVTFTHTEVDPARRGEGIGGALIRASLDDVRHRGLRVVPQCPFYAGWFADHPEATDLLA